MVCNLEVGNLICSQHVGPQGELLFADSNPVTLKFGPPPDPTKISRKWGQIEQGVRVDLTLDKPLSLSRLVLIPIPPLKTDSPFRFGYFYCINCFFVYIEEMREHNYLGEFELMLLLTLIRLGDEAYGVPLSRELALRRGRDVSVGSVYAALDRLELKGLVASSLGESTPERGGRAKRYFRVTEQGLRSVHETRKVLNKLWKSLPSVRGDLA